MDNSPVTQKKKKKKKKAKKQKRQANGQQAKQKQRHTPAQVPFSGPAASEAGVGLPRAMLDEEPLLEAFFDGRGGLPVLSGPPAALARLLPDAALASDAENSGVTLAVASSSHVDVLDAAAPLTGKRRDPESGSEFFFFFLGYRGIVHPPSADEGTGRIWFEPEQRPRKRVPKRSVHGKQSPQGASKMSWRQDDQP